MALYKKVFTVPGRIEDVFAYLSDYENLAEWDAVVTSARRATAGGPGPDARYDVVASLAGLRLPIAMQVDVFHPPHRLVLSGEGRLVRVRDAFHVTPAGRKIRVGYEGEVLLRGPLAHLDPVLGPVLRVAGDRAMDRLREILTARGRAPATAGERAA